MKLKDIYFKTRVWATSAQRLVMLHALSRTIPYYLVTGYPKSGASWFSQMLADYLELPFPRGSTQWAPLKPAVLQGHYQYNDLLSNVFCVLRDGRDVMVSAYFWYLRHDGSEIPYRVRRHRQRVPFKDYENIQKNLPRFIEYVFLKEDSRWNRFRWDEFTESCLAADRKDVALIRYEDLLEDAAGELGMACESILDISPDFERLRKIEKEYSFENQTGRQRGNENVEFTRKGVAGDWKNKFTKKACRVFDRLAGDTLIEAGYEEDRSWIY